MADYEDPDSIPATLDSTDQDTARLTRAWKKVNLYNREDGGGEPLWFTINGNDVEAEALGNYLVEAGTALDLELPAPLTTKDIEFKIAGLSNDYILSGVG